MDQADPLEGAKEKGTVTQKRDSDRCGNRRSPLLEIKKYPHHNQIRLTFTMFPIPLCLPERYRQEWK